MSVCYSCAREEFEPFADQRCRVCDLPVGPEQKCGNPVCGWGEGRYFGWNYAVAMRTGALNSAINAYKFAGQWRWARIFGRVLAGFLDDQYDLFAEFDVIVTNPCYDPDNQHRGRLHTILEAVREESEYEWPIDTRDPPLIIKTEETESMKMKPWAKKREIADGPLRRSLCVTEPAAVAGRDVLVFDDIFTSGLTLYAAARCLREAGASRVCGVSLSRQPWG